MKVGEQERRSAALWVQDVAGQSSRDCPVVLVQHSWLLTLTPTLLASDPDPKTSVL